VIKKELMSDLTGDIYGLGGKNPVFLREPMELASAVFYTRKVDQKNKAFFCGNDMRVVDV